MRGIPSDGDAIRRLRAKRAWTQERVAALCGLSVRTIRAAERGRRLDAATLRLLAAVFDAPLDQVVEGPSAGHDTHLRRIDLVENWKEAYRRCDVAAQLEFHHRESTLDLTDAGLPGVGPARGIEALRGHFEAVFESFPVVGEVGPSRYDSVGDRFFHRSNTTILAVAAGHRFTVAGVNEFQFVGDKVASRTVFVDLTPFRQSLPPADEGATGG